MNKEPNLIDLYCSHISLFNTHNINVLSAISKDNENILNIIDYTLQSIQRTEESQKELAVFVDVLSKNSTDIDQNSLYHEIIQDIKSQTYFNQALSEKKQNSFKSITGLFNAVISNKKVLKQTIVEIQNKVDFFSSFSKQIQKDENIYDDNSSPILRIETNLKNLLIKYNSCLQETGNIFKYLKDHISAPSK